MAETIRIGERDIPLRDCWRTPQWLVDRLHERWGFGLDAAATEDTAIRPTGRSRLPWCGPDAPEDRRDALSCMWWSPEGAITFINPPYSQACGGLAKWVQACVLHSKVAPVVAVLPATPDCRWWRRAYETAAEVTLFDGRVRFEPPPGVMASTPRAGTAIFAWVPWMHGPARVVWDSVPRFTRGAK